jgi:hypothetical protein
MLSQQFAFERVVLLTGHLRDVERIIHLGDILNRLLPPHAFTLSREAQLCGPL